MQDKYLGNWWESSNRLSISSEEVDFTSIGSTFQGLSECTDKGDAQTDVLACDWKNNQRYFFYLTMVVNRKIGWCVDWLTHL